MTPKNAVALCLADSFLVGPLDAESILARGLEVSIAELDWFTGAIAKSRQPQAGPLAHYHYQWLMKRSGGCRLLEIPKSRLREMQRRILRLILDRIPAHPAAHGFVRGRSSATHVVPHNAFTFWCVALRWKKASMSTPAKPV